jgi:hypothetical protein
MKKIYVVGLAFAAVLAFGMVSASGASAFSLWDECSESGSPLEFSNSDCNVKEAGGLFGWLEIKEPLAVDSLLTLLELTSGTTTIDCEGFVDGTVGGGASGEVTLILNDLEEEVTLAKPVLCTVTADPNGFCGGVGKDADAAPVNLPWHTELVATGNLLGPRVGGGHPGWFVECLEAPIGTPTNECTKEDAILKVENLEAELEVDLTFNEAEEAECTNPLATKGKVKGTVSILLVGPPERALRAM